MARGSRATSRARGSKGREHGKDKLVLLKRAQEAIECLMEQNGHVTLSSGKSATG